MIDNNFSNYVISKLTRVTDKHWQLFHYNDNITSNNTTAAIINSHIFSQSYQTRQTHQISHKSTFQLSITLLKLTLSTILKLKTLKETRNVFTNYKKETKIFHVEMGDFSLYFHRSVLSRLQRNPRGVRCVVPSLLIVQNICRARTGLVNPRIPLRPKRNNGILHFIRGSRVPWYPSFSQLPFVSNANVARESNVRDSRTTSRCDVAISVVLAKV